MSTAAIGKTIPVARPFLGKEEEAALIRVLQSGWLSQGPQVQEFEARFSQYVSAAHAIAVSSCTTALHLALLAAGVQAGDEVLCPSLSFIATANSIRYIGATPIFVDIDPVSYNMNPACLEAAISPRSKVVLLVHQVGLPANIDEINDIASSHGLTVIEDAACAIGSEYKGHRVGRPDTLMACFSFHPRKILTTGEGGMITTSDKEIASRLRKLRQHAMSVSDLARHSAATVVTEHYAEVGFNYRMTDMQAALGIVQLQRLEEMLARRRWLARRYSDQLSSFEQLILPREPRDCRHNYQSYMIRLDPSCKISRDQVMQELLTAGIASRRGVMAIHREPAYDRATWEPRLPWTNIVADTSIILPLYFDMTQEEQDYVIAHLRCSLC